MELNYIICYEKKELELSIGSSNILHEKCILKQHVVVLRTLEWKRKDIIARNATFKGR